VKQKRAGSARGLPLGPPTMIRRLPNRRHRPPVPRRRSGTSPVFDDFSFRYYTPADIAAGQPGYVGGLKYFFTTDSFARLTTAVGDPFTATDSCAGPHSDRICCQVKSVRFLASQRPDSQIPENSGEQWRARAGRVVRCIAEGWHGTALIVAKLARQFWRSMARR
jgi:hypothetical protein